MSSDYITIPLTQGKETIISVEDSDLANFKWHVIDSGCAYARKCSGKNENGKKVFSWMHRVILERMLGRSLVKGEIVDHKNNNSLDNRRVNLRVADCIKNGQNRKISSNNKSGHKGVCWSHALHKWKTTIQINGKGLHLGYYDDIEDAAQAYKEAAIKYHGEFARFD